MAGLSASPEVSKFFSSSSRDLLIGCETLLGASRFFWAAPAPKIPNSSVVKFEFSDHCERCANLAVGIEAVLKAGEGRIYSNPPGKGPSIPARLPGVELKTEYDSANFGLGGMMGLKSP